MIKAQRPGVGWSAQIDPGVTRRQRLNGGPLMKEPNVERYRIRYQGWGFVHNLPAWMRVYLG